MPEKKISVPSGEVLAAMRKLLEGGEIRGVTLIGEFTEYTIGTLIGDVRIIMSSASTMTMVSAMTGE